MRARRSIPIVLALVLAASCTPAPAPNEALGTLVNRSSGSGSVVWWTTMETPSRYRAAITSMVLGPVEVCLHAFEVDRPTGQLKSRCSTVNATPLGQYRVDFEFDPWEPTGTFIELGLYTRTTNPVFVAELEVLEGARLYPTS